jgi:hypothetical protein
VMAERINTMTAILACESIHKNVLLMRLSDLGCAGQQGIAR